MEPSELSALGRFLRDRGLLAGDALSAVAIGSGHSNPTYLVGDGEREVVVRRPPPPPLPPSAHDVLREARMLSAVRGHVPVPRVLAVCDDPAVIGVPFYVMAHVEGRVMIDERPADFDPAEMSDRLIDVLVDLHAVDWRRCGLEGRPRGYLERQLRRWGELWEHNRTRDLPAMAQVGAWLEKHRPESPAATIVHGDFRLGNVMFAPEPPARIAAVFDWEMSTIGDPHADLGYLSAFWVQPDDPPLRMFELSEITRQPGFPTRDQMVARYEERSGRRVAAVRWYEVLALWKLAVAMEGNYRRALAGKIDNPYLKGFGEGVVELAERASELARNAKMN